MADEIKKDEQKQEQKQEVAKAERVNMVANLADGIYSSSDTFNLAYQMAKGLSQSTLVPQQFQNNPANCLIALEQSNRLNISPMAVMQNLYIVQGKPSFSSSFIIGLINASGKYDMELQFDEEEKDGKPYACTCWTEKDGRKVTGIKITMDMADKEGWTKKNGSKWLTIPQVMLRYRAASFFARMNCPELSIGLYSKEELDDFSTPRANGNKASLNEILADEADMEFREV
jgi:hypothetical protein